ncbi:hypothetical protein [Rugosimonospora africana]|uniref:DUF4345 domain-containing protein n=1 Tax=Rugosimonospora africana TaxID=556532 RepID=A0A8J3QPF0_9ACTN|nr:hypothetical protein [Rugosimonospora africana]GIH13310.1 hypothetical protein Raf01_14820 [Rugosimonospora africana]
MTAARRRLVRRGVTAALGLVELSWGAWAYAAPANFFQHFPGFGHRWTGAYLPYNEHLTSDLGATFLTLGALLVVAAVLDDRRVNIVVLAGVAGFNVLHLAYHARHRGELVGADYAASLVALVLGVLVPVALLVANRRRRGRG